ncbi:hypothetical protein [Nostoc sp. LEGE 12447]|nr:hypothetical protein [Nostoc sp. LEGE 12447]
MPSRRIPPETIVDLRRRLDLLPPRSSERRALIEKVVCPDKP